MAGVANVLTGIMGAAMSIGLTLAGGSHLAPRFAEAEQTAKAAMVITAVRQTGQAVAMASTLDGGVKPGLEGTRSLISSGWLLSAPTNPTSDQPAASPVLSIGTDGTRFVTMPLIADDGTLCRAVAKQSGTTGTVDRVDAEAPLSGCAFDDRGRPMAFMKV